MTAEPSRAPAVASHPADPHEVTVDEGSALPTLDSVFHDIQVLQSHYGSLGIILLDLEPLSSVETECGSETYNALIRKVSAEVLRMRGQVIRHGDLVCSIRSFGEQIAIFLDGARNGGAPTSLAIEAVVDRLWISLQPKVAELTRPLGHSGRVRIGYAVAMPNSMIQPRRLVYRALSQAQQMAVDYSRRIDLRARERLRDVILHKQLETVFQPIVQMAGAGVRAYEGLIRGPKGTELTSPAMLFGLAEQAELICELDKACSECTLGSTAQLPEGTLLFANVVPRLLNDESFRTWLLSQTCGVLSNRLVLEINEGMAIRNYDFLSSGLELLRAGGIRIAVDDLGAGYANLDHVLRLKPDFLKLDISLVRGVHQSPVKQAVVASMVAVGKAVGATVIAEGIEEQAEYQMLEELGVPWAQGYLIARPGPGFPIPAAR